jgi:hypothetical protein
LKWLRIKKHKRLIIKLIVKRFGVKKGENTEGVLLVTGMTELSRALSKNNPIMNDYKKMLTTLLHYQATDGKWHLTSVLYSSFIIHHSLINPLL